MTKVVLANLSAETMQEAARGVVAAVSKYEGAKVVLMDALKDAVEDVGQPLTSEQYDKQFAPYLAASFGAAVKRGKLTDATAKSYGSKLKVATLALLSGCIAPLAGEGFFAFYQRAALALETATMPDGSPVWVGGKRGAKAGAKAETKAEGAKPDDKSPAEPEGAKEGGMKRSPELAAAAILAKGNGKRTLAIVKIMESFPEAFDKWAAAFLADHEAKQAFKAPAQPAPAPASETALGAALKEAATKPKAPAKRAA